MKRLPIIAIVKEALLLVWQKRLVLFRALIVTGLVLAALDVAQGHLMKRVDSISLLGLSFALVCVMWGVSILFAITCHRIVLLGETSVPKYGLLSWTSRETRFFGWGAVLSFYLLLVLAPIGLAMFAATFFVDISFKEGYAKYWGLLAFVPAMYVAARLAVLFPATAIGERHNTDWAFDTTARNGWRVAAATSLVPVPFGFAIRALPFGHDVFTDFLLRLADSVFVAIGVVTLSLSFRFLSPVSPEGGGADHGLRQSAGGGR